MAKLTLDDIDVQGKPVLVRVDFNVPLQQTETGSQRVGDDTRIRAALPTIRQLIQDGAKVILMSHLGRPGGEHDPSLSLEPVSFTLQSTLNQSVRFLEHTIGGPAEAAVEQLPEGGVILLENTRFHPGEKKNDDAFSRKLARLADIYVNDAFGAAHRAHASTEGVARQVSRAAMGKLMESEVKALSKLLESPESPFVAVLGGAKVSDKIGVIEALLERVDELLIGGAMSYTFLKALGKSVGDSKVEEDRLDEARKLYEAADGRITLPSDHVIAKEFDNDAERDTAEGEIPDGWMGLDIGAETVSTYREKIASAQTVVWNGPMGVFEMSNFARGTSAIAGALAEASGRDAYAVAGGGDSVAAIQQANCFDEISHVSTGGGAMLAFLEGKTLPGIAALTDK